MYKINSKLYCNCSLQVTYDTMVHLARVTSVCWSPDSSLIASGGLDTNIVVAKVTDLDNSRVVVKGMWF